MGLLMRPRRPLMRVAAGAAVGTVAYQAGKRGSQRGSPAQPGPAPAAVAPVPVSAGQSTTADLDRLIQMHASGALSDAEFTAAKSKLLGI